MSATENQKILKFRELKTDAAAFLKIGEKEIFFGTSESMQTAKKRVEIGVQTGMPVLITGETGGGKEVIAEAIHKKSLRKDKPFKAVNCGAIPRDLLHNELFGHVRGGFTGAEALSRGAFEQAHGGTLFLDEVGDMSPEVQVALLRVLETQKITRLGDQKETDVDFRIIAATNVDVEAARREEKFREDLYFRLNKVRIHIPPLRDRREDIPHFVKMFVSQYNKEYSKGFTEITEEARDYLKNNDWPGNVRQLKDFIELTIAHPDATGARLQLEHFQAAKDLQAPLEIKDPLPIKDPKIESRKGPEKLFHELLGVLTTWNLQEDSPLKSTDTEKPWTPKQLGCLAVYYLMRQPTWCRWTQEDLTEACKVKLSTFNKFKREQFEARPPAFRQNVMARIQEAVVPPENSDGEENGSPDT